MTWLTDKDGCGSCDHCGMDMDMDPYCVHPTVTKEHPHGLLHAVRSPEVLRRQTLDGTPAALVTGGHAMNALDPIHAEAALRELQLAQRLSAGGVYSTAREAGTKAVVLMCKAMGLAERQVLIIEQLCINADQIRDDVNAALEVAQVRP